MMNKNLLILLAAMVVLSGCKVKYDAFHAQYPTHVNWPGKRMPLPVKPAEPPATESLCLETPAPPVMQASANTTDVPLATAPAPIAETANSIKPILVAQLQKMKAFQKLTPERQQKVMAKIDKVTAKFDDRPRRVKGFGLAIASLSSSLLAILFLCLTGVAPPLLIVSLFLAIAAIILGGLAVARSQKRATRAMAITGIVLGCITLLVDLIVVALVLTVLAAILII